MAVRLTREQSAAQTRERLLAAARRVFAERGFYGASLEAVAEEAGLTKGAVYSRFDSKADLFLAFQEERNKQTVERTTDQIAALEPGNQLLPWLAGLWKDRLLNEGPELTLAVLEFWVSAYRDPELQRRFSEQHERLLEATGRALEAAGARLGDPLPMPGPEIIRMTAGIAHGLTLQQLVNSAKIDEQLIDTAFAALTPTRDRSDNGRISARAHPAPPAGQSSAGNPAAPAGPLPASAGVTTAAATAGAGIS
jgi:AcrR family transcriptional regulator